MYCLFGVAVWDASHFHFRIFQATLDDVDSEVAEAGFY